MSKLAVAVPIPCPLENRPTFVVSIPSNAEVFDAVLTARTTRSFSSGQPTS